MIGFDYKFSTNQVLTKFSQGIHYCQNLFSVNRIMFFICYEFVSSKVRGCFLYINTTHMPFREESHYISNGMEKSSMDNTRQELVATFSCLKAFCSLSSNVKAPFFVKLVRGAAIF